MKLYFSPGACSLSPHIVLEETATPVTLVKVDIASKTMADGSDFRVVNPDGYVPVLELDDGSRLTEGPAIVQYIADKAGAVTLAPANGTMARYRLQSMLNYISTELHKGYSPLFNPAMPEEVKAMTRERLAERIGSIEARLAKADYLMGSDFTVADAYLFTVLSWSRMVGVDLSPFARVRAYLDRIRHRPAVVAAMKAEGLIK